MRTSASPIVALSSPSRGPPPAEQFSEQWAGATRQDLVQEGEIRRKNKKVVRGEEKQKHYQDRAASKDKAAR